MPSPLDGAQSVTVTKFHGVKGSLDPMSVNPGFARGSPNCEFFTDQVRTRRSFEPVEFNGNQLKGANITSIDYFNASGREWLAYLSTNGANSATVKGVDPQTGTSYDFSDTYTASPIWFSTYAQLGKFLVSTLGSTEYFLADTEARVADISTTPVYHEIAFQAPLLDTLVTVTTSEPSSGLVDAGTHLIGFIFQTRTGRWTPPGPTTSADVFAPTVFVASGNKNLQITLTPTTVWPDTYSALQVIMSPVLNNQDYRLVSNTITSIPYGTATPVVVTIDFSDLNLDTMPSVLDEGYFDLISRGQAGGTSFRPGFVIQWKSRTVWATIFGGVPCLFVSEPNQQQWITASGHIVIPPNGEPPAGAFVYADKLVVTTLVGRSFAYIDNGQLPINFSPPTAIDGRIGAITPRMATRQSNYMASAWVACPSGLFTFNGYAYQEVPMNWYSKNQWDTIDWMHSSNGLAVKSIEVDSTNKVLYVLANSVGGTQATFYTFNFMDGVNPEVVNFSRFAIPAGYGSPGGILWLPVPKGTTYYGSGGASSLPYGMQELWMCSTSANPSNANLVRFKSAAAQDADPFSGDNYGTGNVGVACIYQLALLPPDSDMILQHVGDRLRITGRGTAPIQISSIDLGTVVNPIMSPINLSTDPDSRTLVTYDLNSEAVSVQIATDALPGSYFILAFVKHYFRPYQSID